MIGTPEPEFWRILKQDIADKRSDAAEKILKGQSRTLDHYREKVGYITGLDDVLALAENILNPPKQEQEAE